MKINKSLENIGIEGMADSYLFAGESVRFADTGEIAAKADLLKVKANANRELLLSDDQKRALKLSQVQRPIRVVLFRHQYLLLVKSEWKAMVDRHDQFYSPSRDWSDTEMDLYL